MLSKRALTERKDNLLCRLSDCDICPRNCHVNRQKGERGICSTGRHAQVSSYNLHFGEEPPISGFRGSGTIFFTHCNLKCCFCQNYPISQLGHGREVSSPELAEIMLRLQEKGAHNINFVTPTHVIPQIIEALEIARERGFCLPLVYNSGGYDKVETLKLMEGIIDIYMPDAKYYDEKKSEKYSSAPDYFRVNQEALLEMHRQVGELVLNKEGIATRGLLIRHLVLPENISSSREILEFISKRISPETYLSIMAQYHPAHTAVKYHELNRRITRKEYQQVLDWADEFGLHQGYRQEI